MKNVRIINSNLGAEPPAPVENSWIAPSSLSLWQLGEWGAHDEDYSDALGEGIKLDMPQAYDGAYWYRDDYYDLGAYSSMDVTFWPGTCQNTRIYFDRKNTNSVLLRNGQPSGGFMVKSIPLTDVIDTKITPRNTLSAQRLYAQTSAANETCIIKEIQLK